MAKQKSKKRLSSRQVEILVIVFGTLVSFLALTCALLSLHNLMANSELTTYFKNYAFLTFVALALVRLPIIYHDRTKFNIIKNVAFIGAYLTIGVFILFLNFGVIEYLIIAILYTLTVLLNRLLKLFEVKTFGGKIFNGVLVLLILGLIIAFIVATKQDDVQLIMQMLLVLIIGFCLMDVLYFAFSKIRLGAMIKIVQRTYAFEILYGLFVLILSFSFIFYLEEPDILTFGDGLWYSFAIVTTIGFGDFAAVTLIGRILSVVLGAYGLVVVAVLTSIIINFYNETVKKDDDKIIKKVASEEEKDDKKK